LRYKNGGCHWQPPIIFIPTEIPVTIELSPGKLPDKDISSGLLGLSFGFSRFVVRGLDRDLAGFILLWNLANEGYVQ